MLLSKVKHKLVYPYKHLFSSFHTLSLPPSPCHYPFFHFPSHNKHYTTLAKPPQIHTSNQRRRAFVSKSRLSPPQAPLKPIEFTMHDKEWVDNFSYMRDSDDSDAKSYIIEESRYYFLFLFFFFSFSMLFHILFIIQSSSSASTSTSPSPSPPTDSFSFLDIGKNIWRTLFPFEKYSTRYFPNIHLKYFMFIVLREGIKSTGSRRGKKFPREI